MGISKLKSELTKKGNKEKAKVLQNFFKTGKGQYGQGDIFLGVTMPDQRAIAKKYDLSLREIEHMLKEEIHEYRMTALVILVNKYKKADFKEKKKIFEFYIKNAKKINNWDLVDVTCPNIVGDYLLEEDRSILFKLAASHNLWERRIAIVSTMTFIKNNEFDDTLKIAEILMYDNHDLIHKAVGWMLREVGKRKQKILEEFLESYASVMPRTMLRYSIEKFSKEKRSYYLAKK